MRHSRLRSYFDALGVFACELALVTFFWKSRPVLGSVDFSHFGQWLGSADPWRVFSALVRLLGLAISAWLVCSTLFYAALALGGHKVTLGPWRRVTPLFVRRVVDALAAASVAASAIGTATSGAFASPLPPASAVAEQLGTTGSLVPQRTATDPVHLLATTLTRAPSAALARARVLTAERHRPVLGGSPALADGRISAGRVSSTVVGRHFPHPGELPHLAPPRGSFAQPRGTVPSVENGFAGLPKGTKVVVVQPGECLSVIAQRYLGDWRLDSEIEALNYGRPQPDGLALVDDHWIYAGWVLIMPDSAVGATVVGGTAPLHNKELGGEHQGDANGLPHAGQTDATVPMRKPHGTREVGEAACTPGDARELHHGDTTTGQSQGGGTSGKAGPIERAEPAGLGAGSTRAVATRTPASQAVQRKAKKSTAPAVPERRLDRPRPEMLAAHTRATTPANSLTGPGRGGDGYGGQSHHDAGQQRDAKRTQEDRSRSASGDEETAAHTGHEVEVTGLVSVGAVAAASVVWRIQRSRREQAHSRPRGRLFARNGKQVQAAERRARAVASSEAMRWVDLGLRYLGALVEQAARDAVAGGAFALLPSGGLRAWPETNPPEAEVNGASFGAPREEALLPPGAPGENQADDRKEDAAFERWWRYGASASHDNGHSPTANGTSLTGISAAKGTLIPSLVLMRVGAGGMEVVLSPPPPGRFGWFSPGAAGTTHLLDSDIAIGDLEVLANERWPAWPALVALGEAGGNTVLFNLEHAGTLTIEGPSERVEGALGSLLLQLASQPWADEMLGGLYAVGDLGTRRLQLGNRVQHVDAAGAMDLAEKLDGIATARQELAGAASLSTVRAVACEALPHVAVAFPGTPADALRCLNEAAVPLRSGVALVAAGPVAGAGWRLCLEEGERAVLRGPLGEVEGIVLLESPDRSAASSEPNMAPDAANGSNGRQPAVAVGPVAGERQESTFAAQVQLVSAFDTEEVALLSEAVSGAQDEELIDITVAPSANGARTVVEKRDVEVRLLGPVDVVGGDIEVVERSRVMAALGVLAYLAAHPRPVPAEELASALWPLDATRDNYGGPQRKTVMNAVSRARAALGYGANGKERLLLTPQGYRLSDEVGSDWDRFEQHASTARKSSGGDAVAHLRAALELVRGEPFGGALASQFFEWVASEHLDMTISAQAVDAAQDLGDIALAEGDFSTVYWAVDKGLGLEPTREELFRLWMHALGREGRPAKVDDVYRRLKLVLRQRLHPLQEPQRESWDVWRSYTAVETLSGGAATDWSLGSERA